MTRSLTRGTEVTADKITIGCTFARPPLTENHRLVWQEKARLTKQVRHEAFIVGTALRRQIAAAGWVVPITEPIDVLFVWAVTQHRNRGASAPAPTLKAFLDGLCVGPKDHRGAGIIEDDPHEIVVDAHCAIEENAPRASCRVEITRIR